MIVGSSRVVKFLCRHQPLPHHNKWMLRVGGQSIEKKVRAHTRCRVGNGFRLVNVNFIINSNEIIIIIVTGLESYTRCASRAHVVRLYMP